MVYVGFAFCIVHPMGFDKYIMLCIHVLTVFLFMISLEVSVTMDRYINLKRNSKRSKKHFDGDEVFLPKSLTSAHLPFSLTCFANRSVAGNSGSCV